MVSYVTDIGQTPTRLEPAKLICKLIVLNCLLPKVSLLITIASLAGTGRKLPDELWTSIASAGFGD